MPGATASRSFNWEIKLRGSVRFLQSGGSDEIIVAKRSMQSSAGMGEKFFGSAGRYAPVDSQKIQLATLQSLHNISYQTLYVWCYFTAGGAGTLPSSSATFAVTSDPG